MEKNTPKAPYNYSPSFWTNNFWISLWENPKTPHVHDFPMFGRGHESQNQVSLFLETSRYLKPFKKFPNVFETYYAGNPSHFEKRQFVFFANADPKVS